MGSFFASGLPPLKGGRPFYITNTVHPEEDSESELENPILTRNFSRSLPISGPGTRTKVLLK